MQAVAIEAITIWAITTYVVATIGHSYKGHNYIMLEATLFLLHGARHKLFFVFETCHPSASFFFKRHVLEAIYKLGHDAHSSNFLVSNVRHAEVCTL